ncbi:MAG TPA: GAF domain-containing protein [Anaerolineales bacterium]|nr:GAF domain-containing protein [Anaerolineales bacterium]
MRRISKTYAEFPPRTRRLFTILGFVTLGFIGFTVASLGDLLAPQDINDFIVNPVPLVISIFGLISLFLTWKGKTRLASYLVIVALTVGFLTIAIFTSQPVFSIVAELMIVIIPVMIAIEDLSEREFTWIFIVSLLGRSVIQILRNYKTSSPAVGAAAQTILVAQWASIILAILFGLYISVNLNNYPFRVKVILVLGLLTIIPTAIITSVTSNNLETNLVNEANQSLVQSSNQLATSLDSFIETTQDTTRTEAQVPTLVNYVGQPRTSLYFGGQLFPRGTDVESAAKDTLLSFLKKDPINILSVALIDNTGTVQLSTDNSLVGIFVISQDYFTLPMTNGLPYISPVLVTKDGVGLIHFSAPIRNARGAAIGVLDVTYSASILQQILINTSSSFRSSSSALLLDQNNIVLAYNANPGLIYKIVNPPDETTITLLIIANRLQNLPSDQLGIRMNGLDTGISNIAKSPNFTGVFDPALSKSPTTSANLDQAGATKMKTFDWSVVVFLPQKTLMAPVQTQTQSVVYISILISLISIGLALGLTQVLVSPIISLRQTSEKITQGDINATAVVQTHDEIGALAATFNNMTERIRDLIGGLEQRVADRTQALERRALQLRTAAEVGSTAARLRDPNELMRHATRLISQRFGFYHIGFFLVDERGEYAVLRESNSTGGQKMLARGHKLKIGEVGIVGNVTGSGKARIALNVGEDAEYFNNPDLPETQSEVALPLIAGEKILGALDIQSTQEGAFTEEDLTTLQVLADQVAIALENARLLSESRAAVETVRRAYGEMSSQDWQTMIQGGLTSTAYVSGEKDEVNPAPADASPEFEKAIKTRKPILSEDQITLYLPISIRGDAIGALRMQKPKDESLWTQAEITIASTLTDQLGAALDSARLYTDISQRAGREFLISEITSKIGASIRMETILRTTVEELGHAFKDSEIVLQVGGDRKKGSERE